ncbi:ABC transporter permease [Paraliomyxa miuraensis]|uniref:ABC transporter permease n=1 Tax=Paraliomyxa miuraensis TaxID=376150 RepID=UPI00224F7BC5|nr:ABC transporter permease [Paraliomyxa miuraensis]MCX4243203.1 ABC transporter permease [Paraliomyxa miuraensis]
MTTLALTNLAVVRMMAARLMLRDDVPGPGVRKLGIVSAVVSVGCALPLVLGIHHLALVAGLGLASMGLLVWICLRLLSPAMAVSVVGVALACSSLMTALSVTAGFQLEITRALARLNGHVLLTKYGLDFFEYEAVADAWRAREPVIAASPFAYSMVAVVHEPGASDDEDGDDGEPSAADEDDAPPAGPSIVIGKGLDPVRAAELDGFREVLGTGDPVAVLRPGDTRHVPGIVLGKGLAARLRAEVGSRVRVVVPAEVTGRDEPPGPARHAPFEVLDILSTGTSELDRNLALMHISAAQALFFREGRVTGIEFELTDPELAEEVAATMTAELPPLYRISTWKETNSPMLIGLAQIRATLALVLGLMVVVSASSLIASLLLLVRRKRHDIAVTMAVGGSRSLIFWVFEAVGLLAGLMGAVLGLGLGGLYCLVIDAFRYPLGGDVYPVDHLPVVVQPIDALGPAGAAVLLCALASGPVAMLAARVHMLASLQR